MPVAPGPQDGRPIIVVGALSIVGIPAAILFGLIIDETAANPRSSLKRIRVRSLEN